MRCHNREHNMIIHHQIGHTPDAVHRALTTRTSNGSAGKSLRYPRYSYSRMHQATPGVVKVTLDGHVTSGSHNATT
jgi:hypothetical protein